MYVSDLHFYFKVNSVDRREMSGSDVCGLVAKLQQSSTGCQQVDLWTKNHLETRRAAAELDSTRPDRLDLLATGC